jgi:hypothetical protein
MRVTKTAAALLAASLLSATPIWAAEPGAHAATQM